MRSIWRITTLGLVFAGLMATNAQAGEVRNSYNDRFVTVTTTMPGVYAPRGEVREYAPPYPQGSEGTLLRTFGQGLLSGPEGIEVDQSGNVWVLDVRGMVPGGGRLTEFSSSGALKAQFNPEGLGWAFSLTIDKGNLYIADYTGQRIQELTPTGVTIRTFDEGRRLASPEYVGTLSTGNLEVVERIEGFWEGCCKYNPPRYEAHVFTPEGVETK